MRSLQQCQQNDVLQLTFTSSSSSSGSSSGSSSSSSSVEHVQVMQGWDGSSAVLLRKGQLLRLAVAAGEDAGALQLTALGGFPAADSLTVSSFPQLAGVLPALHAHAGELPAGTVTAEVLDSLEHLQQQVVADAAEWRDGNAPGDPVKTQLQQAVFTAGELAAFLQGQRGIALVQLFNGWEPSKGQPIYNPLAIHMLEQALAAPGVAFISSVAPGGVGLTGILYADREPFASWAMHLASFGCQANAVAGSAYYKLLIGQLLGYKLEHVLGYVASSGEPASAQLQQQVAQDIRKLSKVKPQLPWSASDTNIRKHKPAAAAAAAAGAAGAAAGKGSAGFGGKGGFAKKAAKR
ncbi:hypothetical protein OEZ85_009410 [Tetradesmus obliquus]|uniref:Uncharacterized protein n=1 Tax=Tetradesmus obliquus TaxID=3088 RepID=A0ABY8UBT9_TETOB|nr:hypothetical protein OEZ85_009410 [Tetradesmus obliquus]